jgi:two-component system, chemotaxis family, sensor kinase CheA
LGLMPDPNGKSEYELVVTLASRQGAFGVAVDQVVGVQQVVLRQIDGLTCKSESIAGGALMGDGSVALIIDVDRLHNEYAISR